MFCLQENRKILKITKECYASIWPGQRTIERDIYYLLFVKGATQPDKIHAEDLQVIAKKDAKGPKSSYHTF